MITIILISTPGQVSQTLDKARSLCGAYAIYIYIYIYIYMYCAMSPRHPSQSQSIIYCNML